MSLNHQIDGGAGETSGGGGGQEEKEKEKEKEKKAIGYGRKAKRVVLSRIKRAKKGLQDSKGKGKGDSRSSSGRRSCCCFCVCIRRGIPNLDSSSSESPKSDPNCSEFGLDSLKGLMEKSDFLLDECNTHLDVYSDGSPPHGSIIHDDEW